jgi:RNA polymerase sigma-70 factor (ECF subfamily)
MADEQSEAERLRRCDSDARTRLFSQWLAEHRQRLKRTIQWRIDRRLQGRIDPSDVIQEAFLEATSRLGEYLDNAQMPFFVWLRLITLQRLMLVHRRHLATQARNAAREISLGNIRLPEATSAEMAAQLLGRLASPSEAAVRAEQRLKLQQALDELDPIDREVLVLRHFEDLTNIETAHVLAINPSAASNRYVRALRRLRDVLAARPGGAEEFA